MITCYVVLYDANDAILHDFTMKVSSKEEFDRKIVDVMNSKPWSYYEGAYYKASLNENNN